jgi:hypothetical protein
VYFTVLVLCVSQATGQGIVWISDLGECFYWTLTLYIHKYNHPHSQHLWMFPLQCYTLGEVSSALLGAQLTLALIEAKLTDLLSDTNSTGPLWDINWSLAKVGMLYPALGLYKEHLVEGFIFASFYANESLVAVGIHVYLLKQFVIH